MREIGSEFWNATVGQEPTGLFPASTQWYLTGRVALKAILRNLCGARTAALPAWCCDSMVKPFLDAGMEVRFYPIRRTPDGLEQEPDTSCDILLRMDYFGYGQRHPRSLSHPCVIRDSTHSLFAKTGSDAKYYFGSLRKWCGVIGGGYAFSNHPLPKPNSIDPGYARLRRRAMSAKARYLGETAFGFQHGASKKFYLNDFSEAEALLDHLDGIVSALPDDVFLASRLDADDLMLRRRANAKILIDAFPDLAIFPELHQFDAPLCVPILVPDGRRDALRQYLIEREIYLPVHWPRTPLHADAPDPDGFYRDELSLVCDQRYDADDMRREIAAVREFLKG